MVFAMELHGSQGAGAEERFHVVLAATTLGVYGCNK